MSRFSELYKKTIIEQLLRDQRYSNKMAVPKIEKIVLNMGVGKAISDSKHIKAAADDMRAIAGQNPVVTKAKKSIAGFKLRENQNIGVKVTLRSSKMYEFLDRLINIALPRVRDFRGVSDKNFDGKGNFSFGIKEQLIFPEIEYQGNEQIRGMNIVIVTSAKTNLEAKALLKAFDFPFSR